MSYAWPTPRHHASFASETVTSRRRYRRALTTLTRAGLPFQVGGAFALEHYIGVVRWTSVNPATSRTASRGGRRTWTSSFIPVT